jgi:hypothetical protein
VGIGCLPFSSADFGARNFAATNEFKGIYAVHTLGWDQELSLISEPLRPPRGDEAGRSRAACPHIWKEIPVVSQFEIMACLFSVRQIERA